jgi:hypothetical protein
MTYYPNYFNTQPYISLNDVIRFDWALIPKESGRLKEQTWLHTIGLNRTRISSTLQQIILPEFLLYQCQRGLLPTFTDFNIAISCIF